MIKESVKKSVLTAVNLQSMGSVLIAMLDLNWKTLHVLRIKRSMVIQIVLNGEMGYVWIVQRALSLIILDFVGLLILFVKLIMSLLELVNYVILVTKDKVQLVLLIRTLLVRSKTAHKQMMMVSVWDAQKAMYLIKLDSAQKLVTCAPPMMRRVDIAWIVSQVSD